MPIIFMRRALLGHPEVVEVHHLHAWSLASDVPALSAHVVLAGNPRVAEAQRCAAELRRVLTERFGIANVTLELECEPQPGDHAEPGAPPAPGRQARGPHGCAAVPPPRTCSS